MRSHRGSSSAGSVLRRSRRSKPLLALALVAALALAAYLAAGADATPPAVTVEPASAVSYQRAHVEGTVDPGGEPTTYRFQYATQAQFEASGFAEAATGIEASVEGSGSQPVEGELTGLAPSTTYHLRLVAENAESAGTPAEAVAASTFTTKAVQKPTASIEAVTTFAARTATFTGHVNPDAPEAEPAGASVEEAFRTHWHFECSPECPGLEGELAADDTSHEVSREATGLIPGQTYSVVLVAANAGGTEATAPVLFTTEALEPVIDATFATAVSETEATLKAKINPGGAATTFHFEYLTQAQFEADGNSFGAGTLKAPASEEPAGSNYEDHTVEAEISGLTPNTAYRYRVVATNEKSPSGGTAGPATAFTTTSGAPVFTGCPNEALRRENNSAGLADCRAYEMVSPLEKSGFDAYAALGYPAQASPSGDRVFFVGTAAFPAAAGSAVPSGHLSSRSPAGWQGTELTPPTPQTTPNGGWFVGYDFPEDLSRVVVKVPDEELASGATPGVFNLFLRNSDGSGPYSWVNSATPTVAPPTGCPPQFLASCFQFKDLVAFAGGSADFSHILFETTGQLVPGAPETFAGSLYEKAGGQVRLVGVLPDTHLAANSTAGSGSRVFYSSPASQADSRVENAISADGSHVVFQAPSDEGVLPAEAGQNEMTEVYDRINGTETVELSAPNPGSTPENPAAAPATFWAASKDGSRVFFTSAAELTTASKTGDEGGEDLYEYDFARPASERLVDLSVAASPHGARVMGVVNSSADGHYVYFVARGQLDGGKGTDGQPNLYLVKDGGSPVFITTLSESDGNDWTSTAAALTSYVTPDGKHMAFMSIASLPTANFPSGYDNTDQATEGADSEVYEYSAETGELLCGSCDLSGARPTGNALIGGRATLQNPVNTPFHHARALSDNGSRLFFTSPDQLSAGTGDPGSFLRLYEYEQNGEGSCANSRGCQYLLSGPTQSTNDTFLDASADGKDVFFATRTRLTPQDTDTSIDVYDAHVEGGYPQPPAPSPCEGEACHGAASVRPASSLPGTSSFEGPGNQKHCRNGFVRKAGKCVRKHKRHKHHKRRNKRATSRASHQRGGNR